MIPQGVLTVSDDSPENGDSVEILLEYAGYYGDSAGLSCASAAFYGDSAVFLDSVEFCWILW